MSTRQVLQACRMATIYQTVGRTALRIEGNDKTVTILVAGFQDAYYLAKLFKGCEWLGHIEVPGVEQLGHLAELGTKTTDARREAPKARGGRPRKYRSDEDRKKARAAAARKRRAETA